MATYKAPLVPDGYYHLFNQAVGSEKLFILQDNYYFFLKQFRKYVWPLAEIYSFSLLPNSFEFFIRIRDKDIVRQQMERLEYAYLFSENIIPVFLLQQFSNLFNAYAKAFNKQHARKGKLFVESFNRELLTDQECFIPLVCKIHVNSDWWGTGSKVDSWPHSSYDAIRERRNGFLKYETVISWFGSTEEFERLHCSAAKKSAHQKKKITIRKRKRFSRYRIHQ